ncbi:MAG: hypothetical protein ACM3SY_10225 [Candidatus Omnitrophota bacterium]
MDYEQQDVPSSDNNVYYCGNCRMKQDLSEDAKCPMCEINMVVWDPANEKQEDVQMRWEEIHRSEKKK